MASCDLNTEINGEQNFVNGGLPDENFKENETVNFRIRYLGILLTVMAGMLSVVSALLAKVLEARYEPVNLALWKFQAYWIPAAIMLTYHYLIHNKSECFENIWPLSNAAHWKTMLVLCLRGLGSLICVLMHFYSLQYITLGDSTVIRFSTPILVMILAYFVLQESFSIVKLFMTFTALLGVLLLARPPFLTGTQGFDTNNLIGIGFALASMVALSTEFICLRYLRKVNSLLIIFTCGILSSIICLIVGISRDTLDLPHDLHDWSLGLALAVSTFGTQCLLTKAFQFEQSSVISLVRCLDVVFSYVYQYIFLGAIPDLYSVLGAVLVLFSVTIVAVQKWISELPDTQRLRRRLRLLLK